MGRRRVCFTVDLDPLWAYHRIHGLPPPTGRPAAHLTRVALPRFLALFDRLGIRATFFVVGQELEDPEVRALCLVAAGAGHELANHTESHPYGFLDLPPGERAAEIDRAHERLAELSGRPPAGFRSPGYHADVALHAQLAARGYRYDSSLLPSAPYWVAKAGVMASLALRGRPSGARLHPPTDLLAPRGPYRPDPRRPWRRGDGPLFEIPAASLVGGMPLVGTFLGALPRGAARWLGAALRRRDFVTVELHGIDLVDLCDGGLTALERHQPGLGHSFSARREAFAALGEALLRGAEGVPLVEALP